MVEVHAQCDLGQLVEPQVALLDVAGGRPLFRHRRRPHVSLRARPAVATTGSRSSPTCSSPGAPTRRRRIEAFQDAAALRHHRRLFQTLCRHEGRLRSGARRRTGPRSARRISAPSGTWRPGTRTTGPRRRRSAPVAGRRPSRPRRRAQARVSVKDCTFSLAPSTCSTSRERRMSQSKSPLRHRCHLTPRSSWSRRRSVAVRPPRHAAIGSASPPGTITMPWSAC